MGILGAHVSIAGGMENAVRQGMSLGCDAIQIFTRNQRQWASTPLAEDAVLAFRRAWAASPIQQAVIHDSYLINLASPDAELLKKSRNAFADEMQRADLLRIPYLVFHPGSHKGTDGASGIGRISEGLNDILAKQPEGKIRLLLETTAGVGDSIGHTFEQLRSIIDGVEKKERMGVCFDTAHAFAAGYDMRTEKSYEKTFQQFEEIVGLKKLKVFHLNDSKTDLGSRIDRHENIGDGYLGKTAFRALVNDSRFLHCPMILETPGGDVFFKKNLDLLRSFIKT